MHSQGMGARFRLRPTTIFPVIGALISAQALWSTISPLAAETAEEFFGSRKELTIIVGTSPGGGYDNNARIVSRAMTKYLPGNPTYIVQHMPGAGGIRATNHIYNVAPRDGSVIAIVDRAVATAPLLYGADSKGQFEATKLTWIGSTVREIGMGVVSTKAPAATIAEARQHEVILGATGPETDSAMYPRLLNDLLGTKFRVVLGYKGQPDQWLAVEKGELHGLFMTGWSSNGRAYVKDRMGKGELRLLLQMAPERAADVPDIPTILELIDDPEKRQIIQLILLRLQLGRPFIGPPFIPPDRVKMLQDAFAKAMKDPELLATAEQQKTTIDPVLGDEAQRIMDQIYATPPALIARARQIIQPPAQ
jgi:tripartite-type tricarboxylate transporter receptor subunit TctC